jgi:hypothetical protein
MFSQVSNKLPAIAATGVRAQGLLAPSPGVYPSARACFLSLIPDFSVEVLHDRTQRQVLGGL